MEISGNIKIWITGFSRAAATSNMCAAKLIDDGCGDWFGNVSFDKNDIYAYCFATPAGADKSNNPNSEKYNSIFNIVHYYDPVPLVAPAYWDFDRYGRTYIFPFSESLKDASIYEKNMLKRLNKEQQNDYVVMSTSFKGEAGSQYIPTTNIGVFLRKCIKQLRNYTMINNFKIYKPIESRAQLIESGWQKMLMDALMASYSTSGEKEASDIILEHLNELIPVLNCIDMLLTANAYKEYLALVHAEPDFYLAWMQSMDSNYVSGANYKFTSGTGRLLYINCPVDVFIYDSSDNLVASIIDDVPNDIEITTSIDENGQKIVYLPTDEDYTIKTVAREDCKTTITIEEYRGVSSIISKIISYSEIEMKEGEEVIATATKYDESESNNEDESGAIYTLNMSDKKITPDISISEDKVEDYKYVITTKCDEEQGTVIGGEIFNIGEFCQVTATSNPGYIFDGWYIGDNKVSDEETYRFAVKGNDNLNAKFNKEENKEEKETYVVTFNSDGGSLISEQIIISGETVVKPTNPTKDGYTFDDWYVDSALTMKFDFTTPIVSNTTIYAKWNQIHIHSLTLVPAVEATCEIAGNTSYYKCSECNKLFADSLGTVEISLEETVVEATGHNWGVWEETIPATVDNEGVKTRTCKNDDSHKDTASIGKLPYAILEGANQTYTIDSNKDVVIKANGTFSKFLGLKMDGKDIDSKNFSAVSGSTVVTLKQTYLNTLAEANHTLTFVYTDGTIDTTLNVEKANTTTEGPTNTTDNATNTDTTATSSFPKTGDNIIIWISLLLISALGVIGTIKFIKKKY